MYLSATESTGPPDVVVGRGDFGAVDDHAKVVHPSAVVIRLLSPHRGKSVAMFEDQEKRGRSAKSSGTAGGVLLAVLLWVDHEATSLTNDTLP